MESEMTISRAAEILEVPFYKILYYERVGKIPKAKRNCSGHRVYCNKDIHVIRHRLELGGNSFYENR